MDKTKELIDRFLPEFPNNISTNDKIIQSIVIT